MCMDSEDGDVNPVDSSELASSSSTVSSVFGSSDAENPSLSSSGNFSITSSSSGEILAAALPDGAIRRSNCRKCVGRKDKELAWGFTSVIGRRKEMEDTVAVVPAFMSSTCDRVGGCTVPGSRTSLEISPIHFFGVYDGHGGSQVAKFCAERLHQIIAEEWNRESVNGFEWQQRWKTVLSSSFERADNEVLTELEMVGSTAVVAVLSGCQIIVSNCGDSRALLCRGTETIPLSVDQKPDREDELSRIEEQDGKVIDWNGCRVFGVLSMSRAIGDRYLRPWIIPVPETTFTTRTEDDECLILASDGLWDVMSNNEVGEIARRVLRRRRRAAVGCNVSAAQTLADSLTEIAVGRNSSDNISVIVVDLKPKRKRQQQPPHT